MSRYCRFRRLDRMHEEQGGRVIRGQRAAERERGRKREQRRKEEVGGCGIGEFPLSAGRANKETAAVLIAEFSTRVGARE